ncbi:MAG: hypothetical protein HY303_17865 [Candidatus Wallbacteria bacterium]|nr:hypothetical protein [Candidatus Wallbacteria bacterium]
MRSLTRAAGVTYSWRQITGPVGTFENPFAIRTRFTAPDVQSDRPINYLFELTVDSTPPGDRSEPFYLIVTQQGTPGQLVRLFLGDLRLGTANGVLAADGSTTLGGVALPLDTPDGAALTLEVVTADGSRLSPPQVLRSYSLQFNAFAPGGITLGSSGVLVLSSTLKGGSPVTATVLATSSAVVGGSGGGGGGCVMSEPAAGVTGRLDLLVLLASFAVIARRRRSRRSQV